MAGHSMNEDDMTKAELEFEFSTARLVLEKILTLPEALRPTHESLGENEAGTIIGDVKKIIRRFEVPVSFEVPISSVYLRNLGALYDVRKLRNGNLVCCGYFDEIPLSTVKDFLTHMATARPIFGFACAPEEREQRNRVKTKQGVNTIESWVGRDIQKYIPGLYWWTLLPASLTEKHGVSLATVASMALEHVELEGRQHLFRFYEKPGDWRSATVMAELYSLLPLVFDVEKVRSQLEGAKTFLELNAMVNTWK
jgi:hypothetical protein